jgi:protoporphyrinogen oxidase
VSNYFTERICFEFLSSKLHVTISNLLLKSNHKWNYGIVSSYNTKVKDSSIVIIGAGPGGLTAAYWLQTRHGTASKIHEASSEVGGISRTVVRDGWRFDIGGHRFFTKVETVEQLWREILPKDDLLIRPRLSRIFYKGKFFDYPLKPLNALFGLGIFESVACILSYILMRVRRPSKDSQKNFEGWVASRFGWRLYQTFFKTYTEKVWGIPATSIQADWAAQRIKNLNLMKAVINAFGWKKSNVTSLIEEFMYPKFGPGQMWEVCAQKVVASGSTLTFTSKAQKIARDLDGYLKVSFSDGKTETARAVISTMPINELVGILSPEPPRHILEAAQKLKHRDFITIALVVPSKYAFPDNWIYIHSPEVRLGRIQNFLAWSPFMVPDSENTCLGLEYFVNEGDELWNMQDDELIEFASQEISKINIVPHHAIVKGYVVRVPKAYPVYDGEYSDSLSTIRSYLNQNFPTIYPVGRNGMHRYNNQDHSMLTAIFAAENIVSNSNYNLWDVNVESSYHESGSEIKGTGREAPIFQISDES